MSVDYTDYTIGVGDMVRVSGTAVDGLVELIVDDVAFISRSGTWSLEAVLLRKLAKRKDPDQ